MGKYDDNVEVHKRKLHCSAVISTLWLVEMCQVCCATSMVLSRI